MLNSSQTIITQTLQRKYLNVCAITGTCRSGEAFETSSIISKKIDICCVLGSSREAHQLHYCRYISGKASNFEIFG